MLNLSSKVLVTRSQGQAEELETLLRAEGLEVVFQPVITIGEPADHYASLDVALSQLDMFDWVVFSSSNGVEAFQKRLLATAQTPPKTLKFATIGPGTARALEEFGFRVDFMPDTFCAECLAEGLNAISTRGTQFLLIRASRGREVLAEMLRSAGGIITQVVAYSSTDVTQNSVEWNPDILRALYSGEIAWVTITSSAIATSAVKLFGDALRKTRLVSISPLTSGVLRKLGYPPAAEAHSADMPALVAVLKEA